MAADIGCQALMTRNEPVFRHLKQYATEICYIADLFYTLNDLVISFPV